MEELLYKVSLLINSANNVPDEIKKIVKIICRAYERESNGLISVEGLYNVRRAVFNTVDNYDKCGVSTVFNTDGSITHHINYNCNDIIKLITDLTHDIGVVLTEFRPLEIKNNVIPLRKKTVSFCLGDRNIKNGLFDDDMLGSKISEGFIDSLANKIFKSEEFRRELILAGFSLKDYEYKDERLYPSRLFMEYKTCFELLDYITNGALFVFACKFFDSNKEILDYINKYCLKTIYEYIDRSNNALGELKKFENLDWSVEFNRAIMYYNSTKIMSLEVFKVCLEIFEKGEDSPKYQNLLNKYKDAIKMQKLLPSTSEYRINSKKFVFKPFNN